MKKFIGHLFVFIAPVLFVFIQAAELKLEIIPLHYRTSSEIIPVIRPFLAEGGTVTGMNDQLIVKSTPSNISEIKLLLDKIDKKPRSLVITVANEITEVSGGKEHTVTGNYSTENIDISNKAPLKERSGGSISGSDGETGDIQYRVESTKSSLWDNNNYQLQTLEGQAAYIDIGQLVPVQERTAYVTNTGVVVQDNIEYQNSSSGFYVVPNLNGDVVTLLISPYISRISPEQKGVFDIQNVETTIQGRLGEWIEIGGIDQQSRRSGAGILYHKERRSTVTRSILLKVEELK